MEKQFIIISRLFSGLKETISEYKWNPSGIPAFFKLAEEAQKFYDVIWVIVAKTPSESSIFNDKIKSTKINNINFILIPYKKITFINRVDTLLNNFVAFLRLYSFLPKNNNQVYYSDRSNIIIAAILKALYRKFVVVRILGIYPDQKKIINNFFSKIFFFLEYISYKVNYDLVIATQDGSGTEYYLEKLMNRKTKKEILINGTNKSHLRLRTRNNKIKFLFVGTLAKSKGIVELIETFGQLNKFGEEIELNIIGKGPLEKYVQEEIKNSQAENYINFLGQVNHSEINRHFQESDIYISLNKLGSLSNTVLEAISNGKCIFVLSQDIVKHVDVFTHTHFFPQGSVIKIDRNNIVDSLTRNVLFFIENKCEIENYSKRMESFAEENLSSWSERIIKELKIIQNISN